ncbi:CheR family methyltransferase [Coleofasciculus sp. FACHB-SPT9]|uniref:CheR family methyltransferase n=1 Tax=Cyanophyceae TaxID=3028117 RepID=UPI001689BDC2|nr:tetratricopeptide repeat protein [Coleofasciculus sp. FACHB-SPT9]
MSFQRQFNEALIQRFIQLIGTHTGLQIRLQEREALCEKICFRMNVISIYLPEAYYQLLETDTYQSQGEWQELANLLTIGESYFFRDKGQFSLLRYQILPRLIAAKKETKTLRIWSAGCSTGEEPYSLAILLTELIPDWESWNLYILGTDINQESINKAKQGVYSSWSFRLLDQKLQNCYFEPHGTEWKINNNIQDIVDFKTVNLIKTPFPNLLLDVQNIDLILCRNVFVYFDKPAISLVVNKFYNTLQTEGYLLTAHAELQGIDISLFHTESFPESTIYQRPKETVGGKLSRKKAKVYSDTEEPILCPSSLAANKVKIELAHLVSKNYSLVPIKDKISNEVNECRRLSNLEISEKSANNSSFQTFLCEAETLFKQKYYPSAIQKTEQAIALAPKNFDSYYLMAQIYANLGEYGKAVHYCQQALKIDSLSEKPLYLLAHIAEERGDVEEAKSLLKKIIYLVPSSILAYLEISGIYELEGNLSRALKMRTVALGILKKLPQESIVESQEKMTVGELIVHIQKMFQPQL